MSTILGYVMNNLQDDMKTLGEASQLKVRFLLVIATGGQLH